MDLETIKSRGAHKETYKKKNLGKYCKHKSRSVHTKLDKNRTARKEADRHSHHRRRNHVRNVISHYSPNDIDNSLMPPISSAKQRCKINHMMVEVILTKFLTEK